MLVMLAGGGSLLQTPEFWVAAAFAGFTVALAAGRAA